MEDKKLWDAYLADRTDANRNAIFEEHWPSVTATVTYVMGKLGGGGICDEMLSHVAEIMLTDLIPGFDQTHGLAFAKHLQWRIRLVVYDKLRTDYGGPRRQKKMRKRIDSYRNELSKIIQCCPNDYDLAEFMGITEQEIAAVSVEDGSNEYQPIYTPPDSRFSELVDGLDETCKAILTLAYVGKCSAEDIAKILVVGTSTVRRRWNESIVKLQRDLRN